MHPQTRRVRTAHRFATKKCGAQCAPYAVAAVREPLSRRQFLQGGVLLLAFALTPAGLEQAAKALAKED